LFPVETINAANLSVGQAGTSDGFKIVRFKGGAGTLELTGSDPIGFGDDGSASNDFIDFVSGNRGRLVTTKDASYFAALWDSGHLRINGQAGTVGQFTNSAFTLINLGDGRRALVLDVGQRIDFDDDGINDVWENERAGGTSLLSLGGDYDQDGVLDIDEFAFDFDPLVGNRDFAFNLDWDPITSRYIIRFPSLTTRKYLVEYSPDLSEISPWEELSRATGINGDYTLSHEWEEDTGFYRIQVYIP
jgi:hypothetical protein